MRQIALPLKSFKNSDQISTADVANVAADDGSIAAATRTIRNLLKRTSEDMIAIGQELIKARSLFEHGAWEVWLRDELRLSPATARRFIRFAEVFGDKSLPRSDLSGIDRHALVVLCAPGVSKVARVEAIDRAAAGEHITEPIARTIANKPAKSRRVAKSPANTSVINADPIEDLAAEIVRACADGKWRSVTKIGGSVKAADSAIREALVRLGSNCVTTRKAEAGVKTEYLIRAPDEVARVKQALDAAKVALTDLRLQLDAKEAEVAQLEKKLLALSTVETGVAS
jgi:hypothetical protein